MKRQRFILAAAALLAGLTVCAEIREEWSFQNDPSGTVLSNALNTGSDWSVFEPGGAGVLEADGLGRLSSTPSETTLWGSGAELDADVVDSTDVRYLRYDLNYDFSSTNREVGTSVGIGFVDSTGSEVAGLTFFCDPSGLGNGPAGTSLDLIKTDFDPTGTLSAIAKVDVAEGEVTVWFDTTGGNTFTESSPATNVTVSLSSIADLRILATGEATPSGSGDFIDVENIRVADTWAEITGPLLLVQGIPYLTSTMTDSRNGGMVAGQTNTVSVVILNRGGAASNVTSVLTHDGGAGLLIVSSNTAPATVGSGESITNTYEVVALADGNYEMVSQVFADGITNSPVTLDLVVGVSVNYASYSIANETNGLFAGKAEPGESFDLLITSINDGGLTVSNITNSVTADSTYFTITPASDTYASLNVGDSTVSVYRVTCSADTPNGPQTFTVVNRTADNAWSRMFTMNIVRQSAPAVSTNSLTLRMAPGQSASASVTLMNNGNAGTSFDVSADRRLPVFYAMEEASLLRTSFWSADLYPDTVFNSWSGTDSDPQDIGFSFTLFGKEYTSFSVSQYGFCTLIAPGGATATLKPFSSTETVAQSTVRYDLVKNGQLVIAWGNGTGHEFQLRLNDSGIFEFLYQDGSWSGGEIGVTAGTLSQTFDYVPGQDDSNAIRLLPETWVSFAPDHGELDGFGDAQVLTFYADAAEIETPASYAFTATVDWGGSADEIDVTVIVESESMELAAPADFAFSGPAGYISTPAILTVTNIGNVPLSYAVIDGGLWDADYTTEELESTQWRHIPETLDTVLDGTVLDTEPVAIGFPFVFFGRTVSNLTVWTDGILTFDDGAYIAPYYADLVLDENASVRVLTDASLDRFTVTWDKLAEPESGVEDQTFQVVLHRDGTIYLNYQELTGRVFDEVLRVETNLVTETTYVTNTIGNYTWVDEVETVVGTNLVTVYNEDFSQRSFELTPGMLQVIRFSPVSGTIPVGETADIQLIGDARSLTEGAIAGTYLDFVYAGGTNTVDVTFTATNSTGPIPDRIRTAMWGTEEPVVSFELNPDGSRMLSWPSAGDSLSRVYQVLYTTDLAEGWMPLATVTNQTVYLDFEHSNEPVIFYKITVK